MGKIDTERLADFIGDRRTVIKQVDIFVFKATADVPEAGDDLFRRKMIAGFLLDQAYDNQRNKTGQHMRVYPVLGLFAVEQQFFPDLFTYFTSLLVEDDVFNAGSGTMCRILAVLLGISDNVLCFADYFSRSDLAFSATTNLHGSVKFSAVFA